MVTPVASSGPLLATTTIYVTVSPGLASGRSTVLVITRSMAGAANVALDELFSASVSVWSTLESEAVFVIVTPAALARTVAVIVRVADAPAANDPTVQVGGP
ncbi:hypothetical protein BMS3Bbin02_01195 [bacterium BMS3Bbin02]|nr:hypothetical protein BMS3Bbin02_01195 [bacterium BMS3Bbin02]